MNTLIILAGFTGVGKSFFLSESQKYGISSLQLRRLWEARFSNSRTLSEKAFLELEKKTGNRNEWLNILLPEIKQKMQTHNNFIIEGISNETEIDWIQQSIKPKNLYLIYLYTKDFDKRVSLVSKRDNLNIDEARNTISRSDTNRSNLGMSKIINRANIQIENKYDASFPDQIKNFLAKLK